MSNEPINFSTPEELQIYRSLNNKFVYVCLQYVSPLEFYTVFPNAFPIADEKEFEALIKQGAEVVEVTADGKTPTQRVVRRLE